MTSVEQKLRTIVTETFLIGNTSELHGDDSFIETGIIDSTGILQLVEFVEQEFGVKVDDEDLVPENLDSINRLVAFVERKKALPLMVAKDAVPCSVGAASPSSN